MSEQAGWKTAWVTGASTGLGRAIALRLASGGCRVAISARSADKLAALAAEHPSLVPFPLDVTDTEATAAVAEQIIAQMGVPDLVVLNAGIGVFKNSARLDANLFRRAIETNTIGIANALAPIVPGMVARGSGHIALMGSLASYRGFPRAAHYAPTKAAVKSLAECLRCDLEEKGIDITLISPGYIETDLTEGIEVPKPGLMGLAPAVDRIMRGLEGRRYEIAFPWHIAYLVKLGARVWSEAYFFVIRWTVGRH